MTVDQLRQLLAGVDGTLEVMSEVSFDEGAGYEVAPLLSVGVEERCDGVPALYLFADREEGEGEESAFAPRGKAATVLRLVR